jgi:hypothetical protein
VSEALRHTISVRQVRPLPEPAALRNASACNEHARLEAESGVILDARGDERFRGVLSTVHLMQADIEPLVLSGLRRIEIFLHHDQGQLSLPGCPGPTVHATGSTTSKPIPTSFFT